MTLTYSGYLRLDELLSLQRPASEEHDEILFIVIHQVYELWFKEILHELDRARALLVAGDTPGASHILRRILTILKIAVAQTDVLETMTPLEFLSFRDRLETASGSQSWQFREIEFAMGIKDPALLDGFPAGSEARRRLAARLAQPALWDALAGYLAGRGHPVPKEVLERDVAQPIEPSAEMQRVLITAYRRDATARNVCERLVDLDEGVQEWRYRHVKMVERTIGTKRGTGGSSGVKFLMGTLFRPAFPDLWAIRTEL